eukprot:TRINITY_DN78743_c0_g1_i1.p1 TRINITY_DN78743_c0_g1~~TRINITY_DN78743_c0_g1_i1.p1  ORF type:complete len:200 (-),score=26.25 TRINITY_DN78743_c0_g1_i1:62-589(-)
MTQSVPQNYQITKRRRMSVEDLREQVMRLSLSGIANNTEEGPELLVGTLPAALPALESMGLESQDSLGEPGEGLRCDTEKCQPKHRRNLRAEGKPPCLEVSYADPALEPNGLACFHRNDALHYLKRSRETCWEEVAMLPCRVAVVNERPVETEESYHLLLSRFDEHRMSGQRDIF